MTGGVDRQHGSVQFDPFASSTYTTPNTQYNPYTQGYHQQAVQAPAAASPYGMPSYGQQYYDAQGFSDGSTPYHPADMHASANSAPLPGFLYDSAQGTWYNAPAFAPAATPPPSTSSTSLVIPPVFTAILEKLTAHIEASAFAATEQQKQIDALNAQMVENISASASKAQPSDKSFKKPASTRYRECEPCEEEEQYDENVYVSELILKPLHSDTAKALRASGGSLSLDQNEKFIERFKNRVEVQHRILRVLLSLNDDEWAELATVSPTRDFRGYLVADFFVANRWIADAFLNCLNYQEARVSNFENSLSKDEMTDGRAILAKASRLGDSSVGSQRIDAEQAFAKCFPFALGADSDQTKQASIEILAKFKRTAAYEASKYDPIAVRRVLLGKVPRTVKTLDEKVERWECALLEAEIKFRHDPDRLHDEPFTKEQLVEYIALALKKEAPANANQSTGRKTRDTDGGGRNSGKDGERGGKKICLNCGAIDHETKVCTKACNGLKGCACSAGGKCHLKQKDKPLKHAECKNAAGKKLPKFLFDGLRNKHKEKFPLLYAAANAAAEEEDEDEGEAIDVKPPKSILKPKANAAMLTSAVHGGSIMLHSSASRYSPLAVDDKNEDKDTTANAATEMEEVGDDAMARIRAQEKSISRVSRMNAERHEQVLLDDAIKKNAPLRALHQLRLQAQHELSSTMAAHVPKSVIKRRILPTRCDVSLRTLHEQCVARAQASTSAKPIVPHPDVSSPQVVWPPKRLLRHPLPTREGKMRVLSTTALPFSPQPELRECESSRPSPPSRPKPPPTRTSKGKEPRGGKLFPEESDEDLTNELNLIANTGKPSERVIRAMQRKDRAAQNGERTPEESYLSHQRNVLRRQCAVAAGEASHARVFAERHDASHAQVSERMTQILQRSE